VRAWPWYSSSTVLITRPGLDPVSEPNLAFAPALQQRGRLAWSAAPQAHWIGLFPQMTNPVIKEPSHDTTTSTHDRRHAHPQLRDHHATSYIHYVAEFSKHFNRSPQDLDLRRQHPQPVLNSRSSSEPGCSIRTPAAKPFKDQTPTG